MSRFIRRALPFVAVAAIVGVACQVPPTKKGTPEEPPVDVGPGTPGVQHPCAASATLAPFTQDELDTNWGEDRRFPTGGVTSVSFQGCDDVAQFSVVSADAHPTTHFQRTEGLKNPPGPAAGPGGDFGNAVHANLYLDPAWQDTAVRAGIWVVGDNGAGARDNLFGILEFTNLEPITSGTDLGTASGDHEGFRIWDSVGGGFTDVGTAFAYGEWVTLRIELDTSGQQYNYFVNGALIGSASAGDQFIREVFINQFNFGTHTFENLNTDDYDAHWNAGV